MRRIEISLGLLISMSAWAGCNGGSGSPVSTSTTATPIKKLIVVIPENRSFDNVFGTYVPPTGQNIWNLLSSGIVNADGSPGPNFGETGQAQASDTSTYQLAPPQSGAYPTLPPPGLRLALTLAPGLVAPTLLVPDPGIDATSQELLFVGSETYSTPANPCTPDPQAPLQCLGENFDARYPAGLPNGSYQTTGAATPYTSHFGDAPHRFFQNWQQLDCSVANINAGNPGGCKTDLLAWVDDTVGTGGNGDPVPSPTFYGGASLGFYNMSLGDFPYLLSLAQNYAISDNYHQAILGGTGANHQELLTGDEPFYSDGNGNPV